MRQRRIRVAADVELDVTESGERGAPVVVLLHGFPESAHSWRHQVGPLAAAGWHVIAPDQRGYAGSTAPASIDAYRADHLTDDVCALLDDVGADQAVIVGHDWGALVTWHLAQARPERCRAVVAASVPFQRWTSPPIEVMRRIHGDRFFYILYFQEPGVAEVEMDADPERFLASILWSASADGARRPRADPLPAAGTTVTEWFEHAIGGREHGLPDWLDPADFDVYVDQFRRSGFFGPVSWYRHFDANAGLVAGAPLPSMPTAFIAGSLDPVIAGRGASSLVEAMAVDLPDHRATVLIDGAGHWVQQEAPAAFNRALLDVLATL